MTTCYRIRDWSEHFETSESRKYKALKWVAFPNKHDGMGFRKLLRAANGPAMYGAWCLIVQVASKCEPRGSLINDGCAMSPEDIALKTDSPAELIAATLNFCVDLRWIEIVDLPASSGVPEDAGKKSLLQDRTERNGTEQDITKPDGTERNGRLKPAEPSRPADGSEFQELPDWPELQPFLERSVEPLRLADLPERVRSELSGKRAFEPITESWLRNTENLADWHRWQLTLSQPVVGQTVAHLLLVLCAAESALGIPKESVRKSRVAVFVNCIKRQDWASLRDRFPRALKRLEAMP